MKMHDFELYIRNFVYQNMITKEEIENIERLLFSGELSSVKLGIEIGRSLNYNFNHLLKLCNWIYRTEFRITDFRDGKLTSIDQLPEFLILEGLDISHVRHKTFPDDLCRLRNIKEFNYSYLGNQGLNPNFFKMTHLEKLYLSDNDLKELPNELSKLTNLTDLDLSHNEFKIIPDVVFELPNLQCLDMTYNRIVYSDKYDFTKLPNLTHLYWYQNNLTEENKRKIKKQLPKGCRVYHGLMGYNIVK